MSNKISRRAFLKCAGDFRCSGRLCQPAERLQTNGRNTTVNDVKVGDTVKNWNGLGVQLSSVFHLTQDPAQPGYEYLGVARDRAEPQQDRDLYHRCTGRGCHQRRLPVPPLENVDANFQAMAAATTDFVATCDGQGAASVPRCPLYNSNSQSFSDSESLPPQGSGYIVLMLMCPKNWKELQVTYMPTFAPDKTLTLP